MTHSRPMAEVVFLVHTSIHTRRLTQSLRFTLGQGPDWCDIAPTNCHLPPPRAAPFLLLRN